MEKEYWDKFYKQEMFKDVLPPSQFAAFTAGMLSTKEVLVIDYGCGTGRDSIFLANYVEKVIAVDQVNSISDNLIDCNDKLTFCYPKELEKKVKKYRNKGLTSIIYARFFLHALDESEQDLFLDFCNKLLFQGELLFFEFRTTEDEALEKETKKHYRRYQSLRHLCLALKEKGFDVVYSIEGKGYAVYKKDDAIVARVVAQKI